jgi:hypothetical protein
MQSLLVLRLATHVATTGLEAVQRGSVDEAQNNDGCEQTSNSLEGFNIKVFWI